MKILIFIFLLLFLFNCSKKEFGTEVFIKKFTPVLHIKKNPGNYLNKSVKVRGKVVEESSFHYWVTIQDEFIIIMINLEKLKGIPNLIDKNIIVEGQFIRSKEGYCMTAKWLKIGKAPDPQ